MNNLSDFLPIIIAVIYGLYHLFKMLGKRSGPADPPTSSPPPADTFGGEQGDDWEDLLEALGQKEKPKDPRPMPPPLPAPRIEPVQPKVYSPPPPLLQPVAEVRREIARIEPRHSIPEPDALYQPTIAQATELKFARFDLDNARDANAPVGMTATVLPGLHARQIRNFLSDRERLREAIVLNEVLSKPLALR